MCRGFIGEHSVHIPSVMTPFLSPFNNSHADTLPNPHWLISYSVCLISCTGILLIPFGLSNSVLGLHCCFGPGGISFFPFPNFSGPYRDELFLLQAKSLPLETFHANHSPLWCLLYSTGTLTHLIPPCPPLECLTDFLLCSYLNPWCFETPGLPLIHTPFSPCSTISHWLF